MDLWGIFMFFFLAFLIMSCCGYCCSRKQRGAVLSGMKLYKPMDRYKEIVQKAVGYGKKLEAPVVVTSATHTAPGGYPVTQMPVGATTTTYQTHTYAAPYPPQGAPIHMPMPMPTGQPPAVGIHPNMAPYPPMPAASMNPPSYDVAVSGAGVGHPNDTAYQKQAPYNPNFQM